MKRITFILPLLLMSVISTGIISDNAAYAAPAKKTTRKTTARKSNYTKYTGSVGKYKVTAFFDDHGNGYYYYGNGSKGKLTLKGAFYDTIYAYNSKGEITATWEIGFGTGSLRFVLTGTMTTSAGKTFDVELFPQY